MKSFLSIIFALVFTFTATAQVTVWAKNGTASKTYTNSTLDTTSGINLAGAKGLWYVVTMLDTGNVTVAIDYRPASGELTVVGDEWVQVYSDTMRSPTNGRVKEFVLRSGNSEQFTGGSGQLRARQTFSAGTGSTTPTYSTKWRYTF